MPPAARILLLPRHRAPSRTAIDWVADRQQYTRVIVPAGARGRDDLPGRMRHPPFADPEEPASALAGRIAAVAGEPAAPDDGRPLDATVVEAAVLALVEEAAILVLARDYFADLVALSSWSMNVPRPPTDGVLVQHLAAAARVPAEFRDAAAAARGALRDGDSGALDRLARERRRRARQDGPERFKAVAARSAGLRPFAVYLDLVAASRVRPGLAAALADAEPESGDRLLSTAAAIFV